MALVRCGDSVIHTTLVKTNGALVWDVSEALSTAAGPLIRSLHNNAYEVLSVFWSADESLNGAWYWDFQQTRVLIGPAWAGQRVYQKHPTIIPDDAQAKIIFVPESGVTQLPDTIKIGLTFNGTVGAVGPG